MMMGKTRKNLEVKKNGDEIKYEVHQGQCISVKQIDTWDFIPRYIKSTHLRLQYRRYVYDYYQEVMCRSVVVNRIMFIRSNQFIIIGGIKMKKELLNLECMLELQASLVTEESILELISGLGNIVEDVDHYPTLPDSIEALADVLEIDIQEADEDVLDILERVVSSNRHYTEELGSWAALLEEYPDNFN